MQLSERIGKTVYTRGLDGLPQKWYLQHIFPDGTCYIRLTPCECWNDGHHFIKRELVYPSFQEAKTGIMCKPE